VLPGRNCHSTEVSSASGKEEIFYQAGRVKRWGGGGIIDN